MRTPTNKAPGGRISRWLGLAASVGLAASAYSATPLAVWNGDFDQQTTRNGVTFDVNGNTVNDDGTVTISSSGSGGIKFTVDKTYNYITTVFTVTNLDETAESDRVLVALGGSTGYYTGVYLKSGGLSTGGINGNNGAWGTTTYDGTVSSVADANTTRTFAATQVNAGTLQNGFHLYEDVGNGTSGGTIVYGGNGNNGLYGTQTYDKVLIGGGLSGSTGSLASMTDLVVVSVAIYVSDAGWPLDSAGRQNFAMPGSFPVSSSTSISVLNSLLTQASITDPMFVNLGANVYLTADATPASNLVFPYDTTIALDGTTLTVTGEMGVTPGPAITTVDGSGTIVYVNGATLPSAAGFFASTWTGTTWLKNGTWNNFVPSNLGNADSYLRFTSVTGYPAKAQHSTGVPKYELVNGTDGCALNLNNGYSCDANGGYSYTRTPKLLGSGTLVANTSGTTALTIVDDWSEFTGVLALSGKCVWFGVEPPTSEGAGIDILVSGTIGVGAGKTFAIPSNIASWTYSSFVGSGTVTTTVGQGANTKATNSKWSGTVEVAANATTSSTPVYLRTMGSDAPSTIVLKGLSGSTHWIHNGNSSNTGTSHKIPATVQLDGAVTINNGSSGQTYTFAKLTGSGNFTNTFNEYFVFNDVSEYTGTLASSNYNITLGVSTAPAVGDRIAKVDSTNKKVSTTVNVNGSDIGVRGALDTVDGVYGLYATTAATVGEDAYASLDAAIAAAGEGGTVTLSRDITLATLAVADDVTINVGSHTLTATTLTVDEDATVTIAGTGTLTASSATVRGEIAFANAGTFSLTGSAASSIASLTADAAMTFWANCNVTVGEITANADMTFAATLVNTTALTKKGTGTLNFYGVTAPTSDIVIEGGEVAINNTLDDISPAVWLDASDDTTITETDGKVTAWASSVNNYNFTNDTSAMTYEAAEGVFGGQKVVRTNNSQLEADFSVAHATYSVFAAAHYYSNSGTGGILCYRSGANNCYFGKRNSKDNYWSSLRTSSTAVSLWQNGSTSSVNFTTADKILSNASWYNSGATVNHVGGTSGDIAIAEFIGLSSDPSMANRKRIEAYLGNKWSVDGMVTLATAVPVTLSNGAVLDLGGLERMVASLSGSGTVANGTLTVTAPISLSAGEVLTLPSTATFTRGTVAAEIEDTTAGTVTLCGSVQDAIDNYTSGTLTVLASETVTVAREVTISGIVAENDAVLTVNGVAPFTATFEDGTLTSTRSAATFVYTGASDYSATSGNFTIGGVATPAVPGESDTVQFDMATSIYIGSENIQYAAFILNADVTVTGAGTNYLRVNSYTGTGKLVLDGGAKLAPTAACTISCPLEVNNTNEIRIADSGSNRTTFTGQMTGDGTLNLTMWRNEGYTGNIFDCDGSEFYGTINEYQPSNANAKRNTTQFVGGTDFLNAAVNVTVGSGSGTSTLAFNLSSNSQVVRFGSLNGTLAGSASGGHDCHATIEVGNLNRDDIIRGNWIASNSGRTPYLRKVGTGTLTTYVTDTYGYILNGGTLVVMAAAAQAEVTTELAGYEVVSEVTYDTDEATVLYTTYTLNSTTRTWKGVSGNWSDGANWEEGSAPTSATPVTFPAGEYTVYVDTDSAACAGMAVNGTVEFAQTGKSTEVHNVIRLYGAVTGEGTVKLHHVGVENQSGSAIVFSPALVIEAPTAKPASDSWFNTAAFEFGGNVTVEAGGRFIVYAAKPVFGAVTVTLGEGAYMGDWADQGFTFNGTTVVGSGTGAYLWAGNGGANSPIDGTGVTFQGVVTINYDYTNTNTKNYFDTTISATAVSMASGASITMKTENLSITSAPAATTANHEIVVSTDSTAGTTTYTDVDNSTSTWVGATSGSWNTGSNWSTGCVPARYTDVTFPAGDATTVTTGTWGNGNGFCKSLTVNRDVTFDGGYVTSEGTIGGTGNLTLTNWVWLNTWKGSTMTVNVGKLILNNADMTGNVETGFDISIACVAEITGTVYLHEPVEFVGGISVPAGAAGTISTADNGAATITGTVTLEGTDSTLTVPANADVSGATFECGVNGYKVVGLTENVYSVAVDTNIAPGGTSIGYDTEADATAAAADYTVVLTDAQETQGLSDTYYTTKVVQDGETGKYVVTAVLDESVVGGELVGAAKLDASSGEVAISVPADKLKPGLCYRVVSGASADALTTKGTWSAYYVEGGAAPELTATLPSSGVLYYRLQASDDRTQE